MDRGRNKYERYTFLRIDDRRKNRWYICKTLYDEAGPKYSIVQDLINGNVFGFKTKKDAKIALLLYLI